MPRTRMSRFELFIGTWNTTGEVLETDAAPAGTLAATDTYRWLPGRHFIVHEVDARFDDHPTRSMEVMGYDSAHRKYVSRSYDDQGASETFDIALTGNRWTIAGESVRFSGRFSPHKDRLTGLWEMKAKNRRWQPWIRLELTRA
jgi:Protein of unknown function (DUF1579)